MRKLLSTAAVLAALTAATPAFAGNSAQTTVQADVAQACTISSASPSLTLTTADAPIVGSFAYSCNFIGQPSVTIQSANGGVKDDSNGNPTVDYGVYLNDAAPSSPPSSWAQASTLTGGGQTYGPSSGFLTSSTPNATNTPNLQVGLSAPLTVAGHYSDTLTFTIAP